MKQKFFEVNSKLDGINSKLSDIEHLIPYENQRAAYVNEAHKINYAHKEMMNLLTELNEIQCYSDEETCKRNRTKIAERYLDKLDIKSSLHAIIRGTVERVPPFGSPLLELVKTNFQCDVPKISAFSSDVLILAIKVYTFFTNVCKCLVLCGRWRNMCSFPKQPTKISYCIVYTYL